MTTALDAGGRNIDRARLGANLDTALAGYPCPHCRVQRKAELDDDAKRAILETVIEGKPHIKIIEHKNCGSSQGGKALPYVRVIERHDEDISIDTYTVDFFLDHVVNISMLTNEVLEALAMTPSQAATTPQAIRAEVAAEIRRLRERAGKTPGLEEKLARVDPVMDLLAELMDERDPAALLVRLQGHKQRRAEVEAWEARQPTQPRWQQTLDGLRRSLAARIAPK
jgi:hypothetical protein